MISSPSTSQALSPAERQRKHRAKNREYMREYYRQRRQRLLALKAEQKCSICGFDDPRALEFHHRDPSQKSFRVSSTAWKVTEEALEAEIAKCDVLCSNCHQILHYDDERAGRPRLED